MPDGALPNAKIRETVLRLLHQLPVDCSLEDRKEQLKRSGLGKVVMFLFKVPGALRCAAVGGWVVGWVAGSGFSFGLGTGERRRALWDVCRILRLLWLPSALAHHSTLHTPCLPADETPGNRKLAKELVERWSRPILAPNRVRGLDDEVRLPCCCIMLQMATAGRGSVGWRQCWTAKVPQRLTLLRPALPAGARAHPGGTAAAAGASGGQEGGRAGR